MLRYLVPPLTRVQNAVGFRHSYFTAKIIRSSFSWVRLRSPHSQNPSSVTSEEEQANYRPGGFHPVYLGEKFNNRYVVVSKLGYGVYSTVWLAKELSSQSNFVALKILRADSYGSLNSTYELDILKHLKQTNRTHPGYKHIVQISDDFIHEGPNGNHLCLIQDLMGRSILDLQQHFPNKQLPYPIGRQISEQVLQALDWLHGSCGVIHTDLKPDNILIDIANIEEAVENHLDGRNHKDIDLPGKSHLTSKPIIDEAISDSLNVTIRITDFGVASWVDQHLTEWIQPESLRAPEVFLECPWDCSVDIWSFGCVGRVLFRGRTGPGNAWTAEEDQLAQMIELLGPVPASLRERGKLSGNYFDENGQLLHIKQLYPDSLQDLLARTTNPTMSEHRYGEFCAFLQAMLQYDSDKRKKPNELLKEPWLRGEA